MTESADDRVVGRVRWFNQIQGIGMAVVGPGHEVHLRYSELGPEGFRTLDAGDTVSFRIETTDRGPVARDLRIERSLPRE